MRKILGVFLISVLLLSKAWADNNEKLLNLGISFTPPKDWTEQYKEMENQGHVGRAFLYISPDGAAMIMIIHTEVPQFIFDQTIDQMKVVHGAAEKVIVGETPGLLFNIPNEKYINKQYHLYKSKYAYVIDFKGGKDHLIEFETALNHLNIF